MKSINLCNEDQNSILEIVDWNVFDAPDDVNYTSLYTQFIETYGHFYLKFPDAKHYIVLDAEERKDISVRLDVALQWSSSSNVQTSYNNSFCGLIYPTTTEGVYRVIGCRFQHITYTDRRAYFGVWDVTLNTGSYSTISESAWTGDQMSSANPKIMSIRLNCNYAETSALSTCRVNIYVENTLRFTDYVFNGGQALIDAINSDYTFQFFVDVRMTQGGGEYILINLYKVMWY